MGMVDHLDFWLAVFTLLALTYYTLRDVLRPVVGPLAAVVRPLGGLVGQALAGRRAAGGNKPAVRHARSKRVQARSRVQHARMARSARSAAESDRVQRSDSAFSVQVLNPDLPATVDELRALARAIQLHASGTARGKQDAILQAFSPPDFTAYKVSKGAGEGWKRASRLYDVAFLKEAHTESLIQEIKAPTPQQATVQRD